MDAGAISAYVTVRRPGFAVRGCVCSSRFSLLELLLFLTALLTGLSGAIGGDRVLQPRQVQQQAATSIVQAVVERRSEAVAASRATVSAMQPRFVLAAVAQLPVGAAPSALAPQVPPASERRLE